MKLASAAWRSVACTRFSVPLALTVKSVCGSDAAQSREGWAAAWITSVSDEATDANTRSTSSALRMSRSWDVNAPSRVRTSRAVVCDADADGPKNCDLMSFSRPITS